MASRIRATNSSTCGGQRPPLPDATDIDSQSIGITACGSAAAKRPNDTALGVESSTRIAPILARSGQLQHSISGRSLPTRETAPSAVSAAIMPVRQKLRPMGGLEPSSPRCNMISNHVRLLYWWHWRSLANDPDRQAGFLRDWAGACLSARVSSHRLQVRLFLSNAGLACALRLQAPLGKVTVAQLHARMSCFVQTPQRYSSLR